MLEATFLGAFGRLFADRFALPKLIPVGVGLEGGWAWASGSLDQKDSKVAAVHPQIGNIGARILDVRQAPDGCVYVLTDGARRQAGAAAAWPMRCIKINS